MTAAAGIDRMDRMDRMDYYSSLCSNSPETSRRFRWERSKLGGVSRWTAHEPTHNQNQQIVKHHCCVWRSSGFGYYGSVRVLSVGSLRPICSVPSAHESLRKQTTSPFAKGDIVMAPWTSKAKARRVVLTRDGYGSGPQIYIDDFRRWPEQWLVGAV